MKFVLRCKNDVGFLYKSLDAENVSEALFILRVKYPELDIFKEDLYVNASQLKNWFEEKGLYL